MMMTMNKVVIKAIATLILLSLLSSVNGKQKDGYDLDSDAPIRIGVTKRIPSKLCKLSL